MPVECDDGRFRIYRTHELQKATLCTFYNAGGTFAK